MRILFNTIFYQPLFNLLIYIYNNVAFKDFGLAVIFLTLFVRIVLYPIFHKGAKDQAIMQRLTPKINELKRKHKHDKEKLALETMRLYKEHKVNPFSQFVLLVLVQIPIMYAIFKIFNQGIKDIPIINTRFLNLVDLALPNTALVFFAAVAQYFQTKLSMPPQNSSQNLKKISNEEKIFKQMSFMSLYFMPLLTIMILYRLPSALALYWLTTTLFSVIQQFIINEGLKKNDYNSSGSN